MEVYTTMRKRSQEVFTEEKKVAELAGWDTAIAEAERQIVEYGQKATRLKLSIETFQEMKERGEPFIPKVNEANAA